MTQAEERAAYESAIAAALDALTPQQAPPGPDIPEALGDAIADDISTTATITIGGSITNTIEAGDDKDFFRVNLQAGHAYVVQMARTGAAGSLDPWVKFHTSTGAVISDNDDGGIRTDSFLVLRPDVSGTYYISAQSFTSAQQSATSGGYTLTLNEIPRGSTSPTVFNTSTKPSFSWDEAAIQITRDGHSWAQSFGAPVTVTYGFRATTTSTIPSESNGFQRFNSDQIAAAEQALQAWASVANVTLVRVGSGTSGEAAYSDNAAILFGNYTVATSSTTSGQAFLPSSGNQAASSVEGDIWINISNSNNVNPITSPNGYGTLMHEIGHALGLRHPGDYNGAENGVPTYANDAEYREDSNQFTAMSYFPPTATGALMTGWSQMPALHDTAAIQRLYGANMATRTGNDTYGFNNTTGLTIFGPSISNSMYFTIWDAGGNDTLDLSGYSTHSTIDLREESFSSSGVQSQSGNPAIWNISIARGAVVENAVGGSGNDTIWGNAANNVLRGNGGQDTLRPGAGVDQSFGGDGADRIEIVSGQFGIGEVIDGGAGQDSLIVFGELNDLRGGVITSIERLDFERVGAEAALRVMINHTQISVGGLSSGLTVVGSAGQDSVQVFVTSGATMDISAWVFEFPAWGFDDYVVSVGEGGAERFFGFPGLDIFFAGGGDDIMDGNGAVDFAAYIFSPDAVQADLSLAGPQFISASQGSDTFIDIEGLAGSQLADVLRGDNGDNFLLGLHGNDTLVGRGGADDIRGGEHSDRIEGGLGADTLWGAAPLDTMSGPDGADTFIYRTAAEGGDTIRDFQAGIDKIEISAAGFGGGLVAGSAVSLVANASPAATGSTGQFLYNTSSGQLSWDVDGAGGGGAVLLATFSGNPALSAGDFIVSAIAAAGIDIGPAEAGKDGGEPPEVSIDVFSFAGVGDTPALADMTDAPVVEVEAVLFVADAPVEADAPLMLAELHDIQLAGVLGGDSFRF